jgi:hypothetical protein
MYGVYCFLRWGLPVYHGLYSIIDSMVAVPVTQPTLIRILMLLFVITFDLHFLTYVWAQGTNLCSHWLNDSVFGILDENCMVDVFVDEKRVSQISLQLGMSNDLWQGPG